jgi:thiosulfate/3-mercaptopyruvate sulfurtransferase
MDYVNPEALVSTRWLADHLESPEICVVDGSWHMPQLNRDARAEFEAGHIPGAVVFDIDRIADTSNPLPHMLPDAAAFAREVGALGIGNDSHVVAYDTVGAGSAARVWWTFRAFGHDKVSVLDGGLPKWRAEGRPVEAGAPAPQPTNYAARLDPALVRDLGQVRADVESGAEQILDARARGRFAGTEPEPRAGLRSGHMPGALNQPFLELYDGDAKTMKQAAELRALFRDAGLDMAKPVVTSCGSGVTACNLALALYLIGKRDVAVYDGSWTEWGGRDDTPIET